ncbi:hypothetical protein Plec18167_006482 [Paecilomyces lecythidis]|uniref:Ubiquitin-like domain-containing protein n=1 Tax=Paecilomyces lecythidis TaxID=3004212 RepID=A0ABR3XAW8_9EURO
MASERAALEGHSPEPTRTIALQVLSPSLNPPNRITFDSLPLTITVADLKSRIAERIPERPSHEKQRLIYRGQPLSDDRAVLQDILESSEAAIHSIHLVLPPSDTGSATVPTGPNPLAQESYSVPSPANPLQSPTAYGSQAQAQPSPGIRFRGPFLPPSPHRESDIEAALRRNIEALRRQIELQEQGRWQPRQNVPVATATGRTYQFTNPLTSQPFPPPTQYPNLLHRPAPVAGATATHSYGMNARSPQGTTYPSPTAPNEVQSSDSNTTMQPRLQLLQQQIAYMESQLSLGLAPPVDLIARTRTELYSLLDDQFRNPASPRDGHIEALLARVLNIYMRADHIRVSQSWSSDANVSATQNTGQAPLYLLSSPTGHHSLIASPAGAATIESWLAARRMSQTPRLGQPAVQGQARGRRPQRNPGAVMMENAVRHALLNQRRAQQNRQALLARNARRAWLFIRLYFFCYLFSESGTWSRFVFVSLAVLIALLSETTLPQQFQQVVIAPVQRHLEALVHVGGNEQIQPVVPPRQDGANAPVENQGIQTEAGHDVTAPGAEGGIIPPRVPPVGIQQRLRRVERSLALFFASLVPGVGERQVEASNAAQAQAAFNAERAREEEQRQLEDAGAGRAGDDPQPEGQQPAPEFQEHDTSDEHTRIPVNEGDEAH